MPDVYRRKQAGTLVQKSQRRRAAHAAATYAQARIIDAIINTPALRSAPVEASLPVLIVLPGRQVVRGGLVLSSCPYERNKSILDLH